MNIKKILPYIIPVNIKGILKALVRIYLLVFLLLFVLQDPLIFRKAKLNTVIVENVHHKFDLLQDTEIQMSDGIILKGWFLERSPKSKVIVYFGGNMEEVSSFFLFGDALKDYSIFSLNYRGYGSSEGKPGEKQLYSDALEIYDYLINQKQYQPENIILFGRSLGSGVATYLASQRSVAKVVLVTPYDSIRNIAQERYFLWPIKYLLRHPFEAEYFSQAVTTPVLMLAAGNDKIIPADHARNLFAHWKGEKEIFVLDNVGHNSIGGHKEYWDHIFNFLQKTI